MFGEKTPVEKAPNISKKKKDALEDIKEQETEAYKGFQDGRKYAEGFRRGYNTDTRESLEQYNRERQAYMDAQLNARLWRNCPRR